jgi:adenosylmethionine-8-amino-7-oxononanoate aminotransferase
VSGPRPSAHSPRLTPAAATRVFGRGTGLPRIARGRGCELWDAQGRRYLDAAGGAVVVGVGHGVEAVAEAIRAQAAEVAYAHGTTFSSEALEAYADELAAVVPVTTRASTRSRAAARRSRPRSRWPAPTTSPGARTARW